MALVVEDGTQVANANSYVSLADARTYAAARGVTLPAVDLDCEILAIKAMDYIEAQRDKYKGNRVASTQALQWPRTGVVIDTFDITETSIPRELINAQVQTMIELFSGREVMPTSADSRVKIREKIGPIEDEWAEYGSMTPSFPKIDSLLLPLFKLGAFGLTTVRI